MGSQFSQSRRLWALCGAVSLGTVLLSSCGTNQAEPEQRRGGEAVPVTVEKARRELVPLEIRTIGTVEPLASVQIKSRVSGPITRIHFEEGSDVREGQLLFSIDPRQFEQAVREAEAAIATGRASLAQAEANYQRDLANAQTARAQAARYRELAQSGIVSRQENETNQTAAVAQEKAAAATEALIASARAGLQGAEARLADAKLQLSYARITAPISGRTGSAAFKIGDIVPAGGDPPLVTINQISPVYVTFTLPEQDLARVRRYASQSRLAVDAVLQGTEERFTGILDFFDNRVDTSTGTIQLKARFDNAQRRLWPGQFVNVVIRLTSTEETVVPVQAVKTAQRGNYVFVVKPDMTAEQRTVESARNQGDLAVIAKGLQPGETVVLTGQLRLRPNVKVRVVRQGQTETQARTEP